MTETYNEKYGSIWTTEHEINFLHNLGKFGANGGSYMDYHQLLLGYKQGMQNRDVWGDIDKREIEKYVDFLLGK